MSLRPSPVDFAFRTEWTSLVATLVRETGSLDVAEDAASEAFAEASVRWRRDGAPDRPGAWLLTTARRKAIDRLRRERRFVDRIPQLLEQIDRNAAQPTEQLGDDQLALIAGCAHPALNAEAQVALTLRYVCGLTTEQIARSFLVPTETMKKRLTRAKRKIAAAGVPFTVPTEDRLSDRVGAVCAVIYAVFNEGYASASGPELVRGSLCDEATWLAELLCGLVSDDAEVHALLGLILLTDSRRWARTDAEGLPILLEDQDRSLWSIAKISQGMAALHRSAQLPGVGSYRLMGSIAALHARAPSVEETSWSRIVELYDALILLQDSAVLRLNQAVARSWSEGPEVGLEAIAELEDELRHYPYFHSAQAGLLLKSGQFEPAIGAYRRAIERCDNDAEIRWMHRRIARIEQGSST